MSGEALSSRFRDAFAATRRNIESIVNEISNQKWANLSVAGPKGRLPK